MTPMDEEFFTNGISTMDDWKYEMRREIQEIVPGLYLGPFSACRNIDELKNNGVTHIVSLVDAVEQKLFKTDILANYFQFQQFIVNDNNLQNLIQYFPNVSQYIFTAISAGGKVVVCCNGGMSRSPTFVVAYIMEIFKLDASQAFHYVQAKRLCINPNDGFKSQLKEYEPIYKARQLNNPPEVRARRRRRELDDDEENEEINVYYGVDSNKRFLGLEDQQQNGANANTNAGYSSTLL